jgi:hypothetical protein
MSETMVVIERDVMPSGNVDRDIGRIEGALKAHEDRMDRTDIGIREIKDDVNKRFDGIKIHLDGQDAKLDILLARSNKDDGAAKVWQILGGGLVALVGGGGLVELAQWVWPGKR